MILKKYAKLFNIRILKYFAVRVRLARRGVLKYRWRGVVLMAVIHGHWLRVIGFASLGASRRHSWSLALRHWALRAVIGRFAPSFMVIGFALLASRHCALRAVIGFALLALRHCPAERESLAALYSVVHNRMTIE